MAGLHVFRSNRIEVLAGVLAQKVREMLKVDSHSGLGFDPFASIEIAVGSLSMERWLRHELAKRIGICANIEFPFPAARIDSIVAAITGEPTPQCDPWQTESLTWAVLELLPGMISSHPQQFAPLRDYLSSGTSITGATDTRRWGLAQQIAMVFDRYLTYRPEMLASWESSPTRPVLKGDSALSWQPALFKALCDKLGTQHLETPGIPHRSKRVRQATELIAGGYCHGKLPPNLFVFAVSSLAPAWLRLLASVGMSDSAKCEVDLFVLTPSAHYWEIVKSNARGKLCWPGLGDPESALAALDSLARTDHPLLSSMARIPRDFQVLIENLPTGQYTDDEEGLRLVGSCTQAGRPNNHPATALQRIVADLAAADCPSLHAVKLERDDDSIQFHSCYGPARQAEVLRDLLLGMFEDSATGPSAALASLQPRDVLVMTPDIELYAPLITAVFSQGQRERPAAGDGNAPVLDTLGVQFTPVIPFTIDDASVRQANPVAGALLQLLSLAESRFEASQVLELLTLAPVAAKFGFTSGDLPALQDWITRSGIRWGRDAEHRHDKSQPRCEQNTWQFGLRRILAGVVMSEDSTLLGCPCTKSEPPGDDEPLLISPFDSAEGADVVLAGKLVTFCNALFSMASELNKSRPLSGWTDTLKTVVSDFTAVPLSSAWLTTLVLERISELGRAAAASSFSGEVTLDAIRSALEGEFELSSRICREQAGGVTFRTLGPMRSVPYKVVCLLGMDEDSFPRKAGGLDFDLTIRHPEIGDNDPREQDRYLLIEAILAAREKLVVLYSGRDPKSNKALAPCVPVGELRDLVDMTFSAEGLASSGDETAEETKRLTASSWMTENHSLQAFSPSSFLNLHRRGDGTLVPLSFDAQLRDAAEARLRTPVAEQPFLAEGAVTGENSKPLQLRIDELARFFRNPARCLLRDMLRINLDEDLGDVPDREPIEITGLDKWKLRNDLRANGLKGAGPPEVLRLWQAGGRLPLGLRGVSLVQSEAELVTALLRQLQLDGPKARLATLAHQISPVNLKLSLGNGKSALLTGSLGTSYAGLLVGSQFKAPKDLGTTQVIDLWIRLLVHQAIDPGDAPKKAILGLAAMVAGSPSVTLLGLQAPENSAGVLAGLVDIYRKGTISRIPLFPYSSWTFVKALRAKPKGKAATKGSPPCEAPSDEDRMRYAYQQAKRTYSAAGYSDYAKSDSEDPYVKRLWDGEDPITAPSDDPSIVQVRPDFAAYALSLWQTMWDGQTDNDVAAGWLAEVEK